MSCCKTTKILTTTSEDNVTIELSAIFGNAGEYQSARTVFAAHPYLRRGGTRFNLFSDGIWRADALVRIRQSVEKLGYGAACNVDAVGLDSCLRLMASFPTMNDSLLELLVRFYLQPYNGNKDQAKQLPALSAGAVVESAADLPGFIRVKALSEGDGEGVLWVDPHDGGRLEGFAAKGHLFRAAAKRITGESMSLVVVHRHDVHHVYNVRGRAAHRIKLGAPFNDVTIPRTFYSAFRQLQRAYGCVAKSKEKGLDEGVVRTHIRRLFEYPFPDGVKVVPGVLADVLTFMRDHVKGSTSSRNIA